MVQAATLNWYCATDFSIRICPARLCADKVPYVKKRFQLADPDHKRQSHIEFRNLGYMIQSTLKRWSSNLKVVCYIPRIFCRTPENIRRF
jgi:hypothetical protein